MFFLAVASFILYRGSLLGMRPRFEWSNDTRHTLLQVPQFLAQTLYETSQLAHFTIMLFNPLLVVLCRQGNHSNEILIHHRLCSSRVCDKIRHDLLNLLSHETESLLAMPIHAFGVCTLAEGERYWPQFSENPVDGVSAILLHSSTSSDEARLVMCAVRRVGLVAKIPHRVSLVCKLPGSNAFCTDHLRYQSLVKRCNTGLQTPVGCCNNIIRMPCAMKNSRICVRKTHCAFIGAITSSAIYTCAWSCELQVSSKCHCAKYGHGTTETGKTSK
mmetsp:Transcript_100421/g.158857  ORF Transcript_100421/g.158857 Transcript_100421/m.158857 type:complete len:273 (-) Transcript_100421:2018-2836(-)